MSEMVERVARAMRDRLESLPLAGVDDMPQYREMATAAIEAMREPTDAMLKSCESIMGGGFQNSHSDL